MTQHTVLEKNQKNVIWVLTQQTQTIQGLTGKVVLLLTKTRFLPRLKYPNEPLSLPNEAEWKLESSCACPPRQDRVTTYGRQSASICLRVTSPWCWEALGVRGLQLALKEGGGGAVWNEFFWVGVRVGGIRLKVKGEEEWKGVWGRVDEVFKGFQRKENSPLLSQKCSTLPPCIHSLPLHLFLPLPHKHTTPLFIYIIIDWVAAS